MNWDEKNWEREDILFEQKRHVNNKISWRLPHIIGSFYSNKLKRVVEYESLCELLFYHLLELDKRVIRYYVQPVTVDIKALTEDGEIKTWSHVPDVLVFRNGSMPLLFQIKNSRNDVPKNFELINEKCYKYAQAKDWKYSVIFPKEMSDQICNNLKLLSGFTRKRKHYDAWIPQLIQRLTFMPKVSIGDLAMSFRTQIDPFMVLPIVYYLIAIGFLKVNYYEIVNVSTEIQISDGKDEFENYFIEEGVG